MADFSNPKCPFENVTIDANMWAGKIVRPKVVSEKSSKNDKIRAEAKPTDSEIKALTVVGIYNQIPSVYKKKFENFDIEEMQTFLKLSARVILQNDGVKDDGLGLKWSKKVINARMILSAMDFYDCKLRSRLYKDNDTMKSIREEIYTCEKGYPIEDVLKKLSERLGKVAPHDNMVLAKTPWSKAENKESDTNNIALIGRIFPFHQIRVKPKNISDGSEHGFLGSNVYHLLEQYVKK